MARDVVAAERIDLAVRDVARTIPSVRQALRRGDVAPGQAWALKARRLLDPAQVAEVEKLPDVVRAPVLAWLARFRAESTLLGARARFGAGLAIEPSPVATAGSGPVRATAAGLRHRLLRERQVAERRAVGSALGEACQIHRSHALALVQREGELSPGWSGRAELLDRVADVLLSKMSELVRERCFPNWTDNLDLALGRDAPGQFPSRISPASMSEMFSSAGFHQGLALNIRLPDPLGPASWLRALASYGAELAEGWSGRNDAWYVLWRPPFFWRGARLAGAFGQLLLSPTFCKRKLGIGRATWRQAAVPFSQMYARAVAQAAARWLSARSAHSEAWFETSQRAFSQAWGSSLPDGLVFVLPHVELDRAEREVASILSAVSDAARLQEAFDEDWFDNPRTRDALRSWEIIDEPAPPDEELEQAPDRVRRALEILM